MQTCLSGILAYFLLLMTMTDVTPQTSEDIPILTLFYVIIIGLGMVGAIFCAVIVRLSKYERKVKHRMAKLKRSMDRKRLTKENSVDIDNVSEHPTRRAPCYKQFLSARFLNDFFFVFYVSSLVISYIWLFVYMDVLKREMNEISNRNYNYTPITTFHS